MCFSQPKMPKPVAPPVQAIEDETAQQATEEEDRRRRLALGSKATSISGSMTPPTTAPKTALGS